MTGQINDVIVINRKGFSVVGVNGGELFTPESIGIMPIATMTACWRGYICEYKISYKKLLLDKLWLSFGEEEISENTNKFIPQKGPPINGVNPYEGGEFNNIYEKLNYEVDFTGGILAGRKFIQDLYVHMGFQSAWKYKNVFELIFIHGKVQEIRDVSEQVEQIRNKKNEELPEQDLIKWIASTFRLDYGL
jgi:hypothetical protein